MTINKLWWGNLVLEMKHKYFLVRNLLGCRMNVVFHRYVVPFRLSGGSFHCHAKDVVT